MPDPVVKQIQVQEDIVSNLGRLCGGYFFEDIESELTPVVLACRQTGKKGKLTITIDFEPKGETLLTKTKIKGAAPKPDDLGVIFFTDEEGHLRVNHPRQLDAFRGER